MRAVAVAPALVACGFSAQVPNASPTGDAAHDATIDAPGCPATYRTLGAPSSSVYRVSGGPMGAGSAGRATWVDAEADCRDDGANTHLAIAETQAEHQLFVDVLSGASRWLGVTDRKFEGTWIPIIGGTTFWTYWSAMPVNNSADCLLLTRVPSHEDTPCDQPGPTNEWLKGYICECDGRAVDPSTF